MYFLFVLSTLSMKSIVLLLLLVGLALAADRCEVSNPIDCGYDSMDCEHTPVPRDWWDPVCGSRLLLPQRIEPCLFLPRRGKGQHHKGPHRPRLPLWCWFRRHHHEHREQILRLHFPNRPLRISRRPERNRIGGYEKEAGWRRRSNEVHHPVLLDFSLLQLSPERRNSLSRWGMASESH